MDSEIVKRLALLEKKHRNQKRLNNILIIVLLCSLSFAFTKTEKFDIIRAKGIVIEDANGKDRILIGTPIPFSKDRVFTDSAKVRKHWASRMIKDNPDLFMKYYKDYKTSSSGIVFMNENGFDRVLVGDDLADANTGVRMFDIAGITWNDKDGFELGGAGVNTNKTDGTARAVVGVDDPNGGEAVHIMALEEGTKGLLIGDYENTILIGMSKKEGKVFKNKDKFSGIKYFDKSGKLVWEQEMKTPKYKPKKII